MYTHTTPTHTIRINLRRLFHLVIQYIPCFRYGPLEEIISTSMNQNSSVSWPPFRFEIISFCQRVAILLPVVINHTRHHLVSPFLTLCFLFPCGLFCLLHVLDSMGYWTIVLGILFYLFWPDWFGVLTGMCTIQKACVACDDITCFLCLSLYCIPSLLEYGSYSFNSIISHHRLYLILLHFVYY